MEMIAFFVSVDTQLSIYSYKLIVEELVLFAQCIDWKKQNIAEGLDLSSYNSAINLLLLTEVYLGWEFQILTPTKAVSVYWLTILGCLKPYKCVGIHTCFSSNETGCTGTYFLCKKKSLNVTCW